MMENISILISPVVSMSNPAEAKRPYPYRRNKSKLQYKSIFDLSFAAYLNVPSNKVADKHNIVNFLFI